MGKLRNYRKDLTLDVEAAKKLFTKSEQPPKELKDAEEALTEAKNQVIKYGFLNFLAAPAITEESKAGETARTSLQSVWDVHKVNKDILKYLGDDWDQTLTGAGAARVGASRVDSDMCGMVQEQSGRWSLNGCGCLRVYGLGVGGRDQELGVRGFGPGVRGSGFGIRGKG